MYFCKELLLVYVGIICILLFELIIIIFLCKLYKQIKTKFLIMDLQQNDNVNITNKISDESLKVNLIDCQEKQINQKTCPNCSAKVRINQKFCPKCGYKID